MKHKFDISRTEEYVRNLICTLMLVIMGFLFFESFMHSMRLSHTEEMFEGISYHHDNFIYNAVYMAAALTVSAFIMPRLEKIQVKVFTGILMAATVLFGTVWVISSQASPTADQFVVSHAAYLASLDDYSFMEDKYFSNCPYQLGMVLFYEIQIRLFNGLSDTIIYTQIINVIYLALAYLGLIIIIGKLFGSKRIQIFSAVAMLMSVQPLLYTTFVYAVIPGIANVIFALLFEIKYFETENRKKYLYAALSVFFMVFSIMIKTNNYIALIAIAGTAAVKFISRKKLSDLVYIAVMVVLSVNILSAVASSYEKRSGVELGEAVPMTGYIAMGLSDPEGVLGCNAMGWYSSYYTFTNHSSNNYDAEKSSEFAVNGIKERLKKFSSDYSYANDFFYEKNTSQWNEPSFATFWMNEVMYRYNGVTPGKIAGSIIDANAGESYSALAEYMNVTQLFVYMSAFAGIFICFRKKDIFCSSLILIVLGAFLYHMIFEAKSQYILPYYILLLGFSGVGTEFLTTKFTELRNRKKQHTEPVTATAESSQKKSPEKSDKSKKK